MARLVLRHQYKQAAATGLHHQLLAVLFLYLLLVVVVVVGKTLLVVHREHRVAPAVLAVVVIGLGLLHLEPERLVKVVTVALV